MKHLSPSEFVDYVEGALDPERRTHIAACGVCQREAETLGATMHEASIADAPEPSPFFWDHLRARVREEITRPTTPTRWTWPQFGPVAAAAAALLVIAVIVVSRMQVGKQPGQNDPASDRYAQKSAVLETVQEERLSLRTQEPAEREDEAWMLLQDAAEDLQIEDARAAGFLVRPDTVDRALLDLSARERAELGRLIEHEIRQTRRSSNPATKEIS